MKSELEIMFHFKRGSWVWCLHCERCYKVGEFRQVGELQYCPFADCDGTVIDAWEWSTIRDANPGYPEVPELGKVYGQYGEE